MTECRLAAIVLQRARFYVLERWALPFYRRGRTAMITLLPRGTLHRSTLCLYALISHRKIRPI